MLFSSFPLHIYLFQLILCKQLHEEFEASTENDTRWNQLFGIKHVISNRHEIDKSTNKKQTHLCYSDRILGSSCIAEW